MGRQFLVGFPLVELTSAKTAPYLIALSTTLSVAAPIIGEYSFNNSLSSSSNEFRDFAYADIISWMRWTIARRTVGLVEKCNSNEQRYFPTTITSVFLYQIWADRLGSMTDPAP